MNHPFRLITIVGLLGSVPTFLLSGTAQAANSAVENSLKNRPEISTFYQALVNTGVINELSPGLRYTVFAPTNEAFAAISQAKYPCFYAEQCRAQVADVLRNHIVKGEVHVSDAAAQKGVVFSIDKRNVSVAEPHKGTFTADGHSIINQRQTLGGMLYEIDGVIANQQELAWFEAPRTMPVADASPQVITEKVYYSPSGRIDGVTETTIYTVPATGSTAVVAPSDTIAPAAR